MDMSKYRNKTTFFQRLKYVGKVEEKTYFPEYVVLAHSESCFYNPEQITSSKVNKWRDTQHDVFQILYSKICDFKV